MRKPRISRRALMKNSLLAAAAGGTATFFGPWQHNRVWAQGKKPIKLGLTCDASGQYANSGQDDMLGMRLAISEFNAKGGVLGRKIEWITADTETNPATGTRVAERFISQEHCGFLIGAVHSGVANAITQIANKYGTVYLNTNSSSPSEAGQNCSRIKFVWDGNGTNFSKAAVRNAVEKIGKRWLLLTNDYVWGHNTSAATKAEVEKAGGQIIDNLLDPAEHARLCLLPSQGAAGQARRGGDRRGRRRHQGAAPAGERPQARGESGLDQQPAGLAGRLGRAADAVRRVRHHVVPQAAAARRRRFRQALADGLSEVADPRARQRLLQRLHGDARAAARHRAGGLHQQHRRDQAARGAQDAGGRTACSTSTPTSMPRRIRCSRPSIWRGATPSRATRRITSSIVSWTKPDLVLDDAAPAKCKLKPYSEVPSYEL